MFIKSVLSGTQQGGAVGFDLEYLVIAGGGSGGYGYGGGGGAGGYRSSVTGESSGGGASAEAVFAAKFDTAYTVTVGAGGAAITTAPQQFGKNGSDSTFDTITSIGGGGGGFNSNAGLAGGSGGGGGGNAVTLGGAGTTGQGYAGGPSAGSLQCGGGGGAGELGNTDGQGYGGDGVTSAVTGSNVFRGGGGSGFTGSITAPAGGDGGGGGGSSAADQAGDANTGGGGAGYTGSTSTSGAGGSGVVILRVPNTVIADFSAGVVYNYIPVDGFHVYEITGAGVSDTVTFIDNGPDAVTINDSLRFNDNDSAYLSRTPATTSNQQKFTWSGWVKRANLTPTGAYPAVFAAGPITGGGGDVIVFSPANQLRVWLNGGVDADILTTRLFRDSSAWYHILVAMDTTAVQASDRIKVYVNGRLISDFNTASYPALNYNTTYLNDNLYTQYIGEGYSSNFDGYLSDVYFIDGEALDPSYFGRMSSDGIWEPIAYAGTSYGTNGFHLDFADNSTAAALGTDVSGNSNDWTPSGITTDDQMSDTPSVNYCTWNPLDKAIAELSDGNLYATHTPTAWVQGRANFAMVTGKWYWEASGNTQYAMVGISLASQSQTTYFGQGAASWGYYSFNGAIYRDNTAFTYGATWTGSDTIGIAFDADTGQLYFYKNGVALGLAATVPTGQTYFPAVAIYNTSIRHNFGQTPFTYTPPTGYSALSSANLPAPTITDGKEHFQPLLYTGNGGTQSVQGLEFQPDLVWIKNRNVAGTQNLWYDAVRGATIALFSSSTSAEYSFSGLTSFDSTGFTVGSQTAGNGTGNAIVAWNWNAGGSTVTNNDGTITSQVRANTDAGFSIVTFTGTTSNQSVGHGLGVAPTVFIVKSRVNAYNWWYYTTQIDGSMDYLVLNGTNAAANGTQSLPTSSVFYQNQIDSSVAYCFAEVDGFSKFGTYTGNGSADGTFVYTGFRPAFVIMKSNTNGYYWVMKDNMRAAAYNPATGNLYPNDSLAEDTTATAYIDLLANGFKLRGNYLGTNGSGVGYIYMAFAENPFKTARAR